jgi:ABC-type lipoprotein release transport system permease subunit
MGQGLIIGLSMALLGIILAYFLSIGVTDIAKVIRFGG